MRVCLLILFCIVRLIVSAQDSSIVNMDEQELLNAVRNFDSEAAESKLRSGVSPNVKDKYGQTPLMIAASKKDVEMSKLLIEYGAEINVRNEKILFSLLARLSPLDYAVHTGDTAIVNYLLSAGAYLNPPKDSDSHNNPAIIASKSLDIKMTKYLLDKGCKVSPDQRKDLVIGHIVQNEQIKTLSRKNKNELLIRFWINYDSPLSEKELLKTRLSDKYRQRILDYMRVHSQPDIKTREENQLKYIFAKSFAPSRKDDLVKEERARAYKENLEKIRQRQLETREKEKVILEKSKSERRKILFFILFIGGVFVFILIKRSFHTSSQTTYLSNSSNSSNNTANPISSQSNNTAGHNQKQKKAKAKPRARKTKADNTERGKFVLSEKGWTKDNTLNIEVSFLTIEDMIYPLRLRNEHEKAVKRIIQYIRLLDRYTDSQIKETLGEEGLIIPLDNLWKKINPDFVRDVYKRSLFLVVENYAERDERVKPFLGIIHKKQKRGNKKKTKSEKSTKENSDKGKSKTEI